MSLGFLSGLLLCAFRFLNVLSCHLRRFRELRRKWRSEGGLKTSAAAQSPAAVHGLPEDLSTIVDEMLNDIAGFDNDLSRDPADNHDLLDAAWRWLVERFGPLPVICGPVRLSVGRLLAVQELSGHLH
jgi:hypothetical protein